MLHIENDTIWRSGEKVGWLEGTRLYDAGGTELGYYENDTVYNSVGEKWAYLQGNTIYNADGSVFSSLEHNREQVSRENYSNLCCAAVAVLFGE